VLHLKVLEHRNHRVNIIRFTHRMTKARFKRRARDRSSEWLTNEDIVTQPCGVIVSQRNGFGSHGESIARDLMVVG
jgi:hypothetical protein